MEVCNLYFELFSPLEHCGGAYMSNIIFKMRFNGQIEWLHIYDHKENDI